MFVEIIMNEDLLSLERWYLENVIEEKKPDVAFLLKPKAYPQPLKLPNSPTVILHGFKQEEIAPIAKLIKDYDDQSKYQKNAEKNIRVSIDIVNRESYLRKIISRILEALADEELLKLLNARLASGSTVKGELAKVCLLPNKHLESAKRHADVATGLGLLSMIPTEIRSLIFKQININEARKIVTVSKTWLKEITSREIWQSASTSSEPYFAVMRKEFYSRFMNRSHMIFSDEIDVVDGEGMLVYEQGFVQALRLNGKPLAASWSDVGGSVGRCMVRSRILGRDEVNTIVKNIETFLNEGDLDLGMLTETIASFLKCAANGRYKIEVCRRQADIMEYCSEDSLDELVGTYLFEQTIYYTQPSDSLNEERVKYYEEMIKRDKRPALLLMCAPDSYLIDGHHKLKAYQNLHLVNQAVLINIIPLTYTKLTREAELAYIEHSPDGLANYNDVNQQYYEYND